jgi:hypothetical protein
LRRKTNIAISSRSRPGSSPAALRIQDPRIAQHERALVSPRTIRQAHG